MAFDVSKLSRLMLGKQGENNATVIDIDVSDWLAKWPSASIQLLHQRHDEDTPYPVSVSLTGGYVTWIVTSVDTGIAGRGYAEVRAVEGDVLKKSRVIETVVEPSIPGTAGEPPEAVGDWTQRLEQTVKEVQDALDSGELTGKGLQILGYYPDADALASDVLSPEAGDAYGVGEAEPYDIYVWDALNGAWINNGAIQGPAGPAGPKGDQGEPGLNGVFVRNLLDNSDFRNPVNQRGQSSYTANGYTIDRWFNRSNATMTVNSGSITITGLIKQRILSAEKGGVYTLAVCNASGEIMILSTHGWDNDAACYYVEFGNGEYVWAALYEGEYTAETLPEYVPKGHGVELVECMRYYYKIHRDADIVMRYRNTSGAAMTLFENGTIIQFPVEMRIVPTVAIAYDISDGNETTSAPAFASKNSCMLPSLTLDSGAYFDMHYLSASADL